MTTRIVIVEPIPLLALALQELLASIMGALECSVCASTRQAFALAGFRCDLIVANESVYRGMPCQLARRLVRYFPDARIVVMTSNPGTETPDTLPASVLFLNKLSAYRELVCTLQKFLHTGQIDTEAATTRNEYQSLIQLPGSSKPLTLKQVKVMEWVAKGKTSKEIARELNMSPDTVRAHLKESFVRLNASNRGEAVHNYLEAKQMAVRLHGENLMREEA